MIVIDSFIDFKEIGCSYNTAGVQSNEMGNMDLKKYGVMETDSGWPPVTGCMGGGHLLFMHWHFRACFHLLYPAIERTDPLG